MIGFTFKNIHSSQFDIIAKSINRNTLPELENKEFIIPGRHGTLDYGGGTYRKRYIEMEIAFIKECDTDLHFMTHIRKIAHWLAGEGYLIFDDEPNKQYLAKIYNAVPLNDYEIYDYDLPYFEAVRIPITFECQPFAISLDYNQVREKELIKDKNILDINVEGTQDTCTQITIINNSDKPLNDLLIIRKGGTR